MAGFVFVTLWGLAMTPFGWKLATSEQFRQRQLEASFRWRKSSRPFELRIYEVLTRVLGYVLLVAGPTAVILGIASIVVHWD